MATAMQTTRVLHFVDALIRGGAEQLLVELAVRAERERFDPAVVCFRQTAHQEILEAAGRRVHVLPKRRAFDIGLLWALVRLLRRERVACLHCHELQSATYGTVAGRLAGVPVVFTIHGLAIFSQKRAARLLPRIGRWARQVVFVGHWLQRTAADQFGLRPANATVVHNGVDIAAFCPGESEPALMAELGIAAGAPVVGTVGNLRPVKDYPCLLRSFALARRRVPEAVLVFVGDGAERPTLGAVAAELGVADAVRFAGDRSDVARLLRLFDVFALSSQTEGISVALLEAMATGLPAVVTDTGGNPEVVVEGVTGALVPVGGAERMGEALAALLADPGRRRAWGDAARERVVAEFSLERMLSQYESIYDEAIRRR